MNDLTRLRDEVSAEECGAWASAVRIASKRLAVAHAAAKNDWLMRSAEALRERTREILNANAIDRDRAPALGLSAAAIDRLTLDVKRIESIAHSLEQIAALPDPVGEVIRGEKRPNGLDVRQIRVPIGVVFIIYESRPNVTVDAAAICLKSGNGAILRGGKEAIESNCALMNILKAQFEPSGLPEDSVLLVPTADRAAVGHLLARGDLIDLAIPRGGESLIRRVVVEARMPVLRSEGNLNNLYGLPLTLCRLEERHGAAVVELGMSRRPQYGYTHDGMHPLTKLVRWVSQEAGVHEFYRYNEYTRETVEDRLFPWREALGEEIATPA